MMKSKVHYLTILFYLVIVTIACNNQSNLTKSVITNNTNKVAETEETTIVNYNPELAKEDSLSWKPWSYSWWSNDWLYDSNNKWIREKTWYHTNNGYIVFNKDVKIYPDELIGEYKKHLGFQKDDSLIVLREDTFEGRITEKDYMIRFEPGVFSPLNLNLRLEKEGTVTGFKAKIPNTKIINTHIQSKPIIPVEKAIEIAMDYTNAPSYIHINEEYQLKRKKEGKIVTLPEPKLQFFFSGKEYLFFFGFILNPILNVEILELDAFHSYMIDAHTGEVIQGKRITSH